MMLNNGQFHIEAPQLVRKREHDRYIFHPVSSFLLDNVDRLGGSFRIERSFKFTHKRLLCGRFIATVPLIHDSIEAVRAVLGVFEGLNLPATAYSLFSKDIYKANKVHFGFEGDGEGGLLKVYLEYPYHHLEERKEPWELLVACKWDPVAPSKCAFTRYRGLPVYSPQEIEEIISAFFREVRFSSIRSFISKVLFLCNRQSPDLKMWYLDVTEEGNPRHSFDFKTYRARLLMEHIIPLLPELCDYYEIPFSSCEQYFVSIRNHKFGHVSCGTGRDGNFFIAIYHEAMGQDITLEHDNLFTGNLL